MDFSKLMGMPRIYAWASKDPNIVIRFLETHDSRLRGLFAAHGLTYKSKISVTPDGFLIEVEVDREKKLNQNYKNL
jgi:hypothetical protein